MPSKKTKNKAENHTIPFDIEDNVSDNSTFVLEADVFDQSHQVSSAEVESRDSSISLGDISDEDTQTVEHISSHYQVKNLLGEGGMGRVFCAEDPVLRRDVAIKTLLKETHVHSAYWKRFMREAQITAQLAHPSAPLKERMG